MQIWNKGDTAYWDVPGAVICGEVQGESSEGVVVIAKSRVDPETGSVEGAFSTFIRTFAHGDLRRTAKADDPIDEGEGDAEQDEDDGDPDDGEGRRALNINSAPTGHFVPGPEEDEG